MKPFNQINVIPFIDIMLVLLAIVLLTATFIVNQQIELKLPTADNSTSMDKTVQKVAISIDAQQQYYFDNVAIELTDFPEKLDALQPNTPISLFVDKQVPFEKFIDIVDLLKGRKMENLSILVQDAGQ